MPVADPHCERLSFGATNGLALMTSEGSIGMGELTRSKSRPQFPAESIVQSAHTFDGAVLPNCMAPEVRLEQTLGPKTPCRDRETDFRAHDSQCRETESWPCRTTAEC